MLYFDSPNTNEIKNLIKLYNKNYNIKSFGKLEKFELNFSAPRNYYHNNLMAFGDSLHKIHPLAGQGFNMTLRDIKVFSKIIQDRIVLGHRQSECTLFDQAHHDVVVHDALGKSGGPGGVHDEDGI
mgnify:CR=1 FL=1